MIITQYSPMYRNAFEELLVEYFIFALNSDIPQEIVRGKLLDFIITSTSQSVIHVALAVENGKPIGFSIYQIDTPESDWCKRPGWGFIREFYIQKSHQRKGCGSALAAFTEQQLQSLGAAGLYLTSDNAVGFWLHCGWRNTHEICSNGLEILVK